jgi:hypothetical protein
VCTRHMVGHLARSTTAPGFQFSSSTATPLTPVHDDTNTLTDHGVFHARYVAIRK